MQALTKKLTYKKPVTFLLRRASQASLAHDSFLSGDSASYIEETYKAWQKDPNSVHKSWDIYFRNLEKGIVYVSPPHLPTTQNEIPLVQYLDTAKGVPSAAVAASPTARAAPAVPAVTVSKEVKISLAVRRLIRSYQERGYISSKIDPLGIGLIPIKTGSPPDGVETFADLQGQDDAVVELPKDTFVGGTEKKLPVKEIVNRLKKVYCGTVGIEYMFNQNAEQRRWFREKIEKPDSFTVTKDEKKTLCKRLLEFGTFESFVVHKLSKERFYSVEGCDAVIPLVQSVIDEGTKQGIDTFIIGVCHRGKLSVMANICHTPFNEIFSHFFPFKPDEKKYLDNLLNLGYSTEHMNKVTNKKIKMVLMAQPGHVEAFYPNVLGRTRGEQIHRKDEGGKKTMAICVHGDAAFSAQGVVYETIQMSELEFYGCKGIVHVLITNQIGCTTQPDDMRSSPYSSDSAKLINAPVFHLNAEDPEKVFPIARIALDWRNKYSKDVVIDVVGYRRHGHDGLEDPSIANPPMYKKIASMKPVWETFTQKCLDEGLITKAEVEKIIQEYTASCQKGLDQATKDKVIKCSAFIDSPWKKAGEGKDPLKIGSTALPEDLLVHIAEKFAALPPAELKFTIHKNIERTLKQREEMIKTRTLDWGLGEAFAWGSLLKEGIPIRLSGQDAQRGTFSHRHHVLHNQSDHREYNVLNHLWPNQAHYSSCTSPLSEYGVLAYEYAYSSANPNSLTFWEAQFGDFATTGQAALDIMIAAGETRWHRQNGLVINLPHGLEGMGPEHSSCKAERYLQMCNDDAGEIPKFGNDFAERQLRDCNFILANCSIPGNYVHIVRRQIKMPFRKILLLLTPKSYLRHPDSRSSWDEMIEGTSFRRVIPENGPASKSPEKVKRLIFCTGRVYFEFTQLRTKLKKDDVVALTRVEQIFPFPYDLIQKECEKYPNAEIVWGQEEHKNHGFWDYFNERFDTLNQDKRKYRYVGRPVSCCPAAGIKNNHDQEIVDFHKAAFDGI